MPDSGPVRLALPSSIPSRGRGLCIRLAALLAASCLLGVLVAPAHALGNGVVSFADPDLEAAVRGQLSIPTATITPGDMLGLTTLYASSSDVDDLGGLEFATNLRTLNAGYNQVSDLSPLAGLTGLISLKLPENQITTIAPVTGLANLETLELQGNTISDVSALAALTKLKNLYVCDNLLVSVAPLSGLTDIEYLGLGWNHIEDVSPLAGMSHLLWLDLGSNDIHSIAPLGTLTQVNDLNIQRNEITTITPVAEMEDLTYLHASENNIVDLGPLSGIESLERIELSDNSIREVAALDALTPDLVDVRLNLLDIEAGSPTRATLDGLAARGATVLYSPQRSGTITGFVHGPTGAGMAGVGVAVPGVPAVTTAADGGYVINAVPPLVQSVTFSKPHWHTIVTTCSVRPAATSTVDAALAPVQLPLTIKRAPTGYSHTYKRRHGVARFTFSASLSDARGPVAGKRVYLQKRVRGGSWKTAAIMLTNSKGRVSHGFAARRKGTVYYRWYSKATGFDMSKTLPSQRVIIK